MFYTKQNYVFQPIAKNASTLVTNHLRQLGWQNTKYIDHESSHIFFVILRDPYTRWISGFVEDIINDLTIGNLSQEIISQLQNKNHWFLDYCFRIKTFDIGLNTKLQTGWLDNKLLSTSTVFFKSDNNLNLKLHHWLVGEGLPNDFLNYNIYNTRRNDLIYQNIQAYLFDSKNQNKKQLLLEYLKPDYDFINSIHFY